MNPPLNLFAMNPVPLVLVRMLTLSMLMVGATAFLAVIMKTGMENRLLIHKHLESHTLGISHVSTLET